MSLALGGCGISQRTVADDGTPQGAAGRSAECDPPRYADPMLEDAIRRASTGGPEDVRYLVVSNASSLEGIECLTNLEDLGLYGRALASLEPLRKSRRLMRLYLEATEVSDLTPLSDLGELASLSVTTAPIRDVSPLVELEKLVSLSLRTTQVADVSPLARIESLVTVVLAGSPVSDLTPLAGLPARGFLDVSHTQVSDLGALHLPPGPALCQEIWAVETPLGGDSVTSAIPRLCDLGWGLRWSLPGTDGFPEECGELCDIAPQ